MNYKIIGSTASCTVLGLALVILCFRAGQCAEVHAMNIAVLVFGTSSGWLAGILNGASAAKSTNPRKYRQRSLLLPLQLACFRRWNSESVRCPSRRLP